MVRLVVKLMKGFLKCNKNTLEHETAPKTPFLSTFFFESVIVNLKLTFLLFLKKTTSKVYFIQLVLPKLTEKSKDRRKLVNIIAAYKYW